MEMKRVDIDRIMTEAKESALKRGYPDKVLSFSSLNTEEYFDRSNFAEWLEQVNACHAVSYYTPFEGNNPGIVIKKTVRKMMSFLGLPLIQQQNSFNVAVANSLNCMKKFIIDIGKLRLNEKSEMGMDEKRNEERFQRYERMLEDMKAETVSLRTRIAKLEQQIAEDK